MVVERLKSLRNFRQVSDLNDIVNLIKIEKCLSLLPINVNNISCLYGNYKWNMLNSFSWWTRKSFLHHPSPARLLRVLPIRWLRQLTTNHKGETRRTGKWSWRLTWGMCLLGILWCWEGNFSHFIQQSLRRMGSRVIKSSNELCWNVALDNSLWSC